MDIGVELNAELEAELTAAEAPDTNAPEIKQELAELGLLPEVRCEAPLKCAKCTACPSVLL